MESRPIQVLFVGNCIDQGTDVRDGTSFAALTEAGIRRTVPGVSVGFLQEPLPHITLLSRAVDHALALGVDVVMIGDMTGNLRAAERINRLWWLEGRTAQHAVSTMRRVRRAVTAQGSGRGFLEDSRLMEPLRKTVPIVSLEAYEQILSSEVGRLRAARCRVILRAGTSIHRTFSGKGDSGLDALLDRVARRQGATVVYPWEHFTRPKDDYLLADGPAKVDRRGERVFVMNELGHRDTARGVESAVSAAVRGVLADRLEGRPGVLARVRAEDEGLITFE